MILIKSEMDWCVPATSVSAPPDDKVTLARNRFKNVMRAQASRLLGSSETSQPCDCTMCNLGLGTVEHFMEFKYFLLPCYLAFNFNHEFWTCSN